MCIVAVSTSSNAPIDPPARSSMDSPQQPLSMDEQQKQTESSSDIDDVKIGPRTNTPSSTTGNRSDAESPFRSFALIETDPNELDRIIDILRQFFPNTRVVECNHSSTNSSRTASRSSFAATSQQQASIESNSSLRVPTLSSNRYRSSSHSVSEKSSFESDIFQNSMPIASEAGSAHFNDSQAFKGKVKDYLQRRYLEQINEHQTRKDTFLKCRSADLHYGSFRQHPSSALVQSFEHISKGHHHEQACSHSSTTPPTSHKIDRSLKASSFDSSAVLLQHSVSDTNLCGALSASDTNFIRMQSNHIPRSQSKRGLLQRCATIDMEDASPNNGEDAQMISAPTSPIVDDKMTGGKITFSIDRPDDETNNDADHENSSEGFVQDYSVDKTVASVQSDTPSDRKSRPFRHSHSDQQTTHCLIRNHQNHFLGPYRHSFENQHDNRPVTTALPAMPLPRAIAMPLTPYSASSDPGPYHADWLHTPSNPHGLVNFHFPKSQEHLFTNAQGSIAQLSTLTKILCDQPSVFTPITPRFKPESQDSNSSRNPSSVPPCQICRQQFDSRQMYLAHYRTHLENTCEDDKSGILEFTNIDGNGERSGELRNYSCKICSKRFSRSDMLNRHLRLHSGIRPYRCNMCNTHFSRSDHLSTHLRTHTGEKPYNCPECSYSACRRDMITRHMKVHSKQRSERKNATSSLGSSHES